MKAINRNNEFSEVYQDSIHIFNLFFIRQRIPRRLIFYHRSAAHRARRVLTLAFGFDREEDVYQFAASAPYSYSRLQKHLALWEKRAQEFATRKQIAQTTVLMHPSIFCYLLFARIYRYIHGEYLGV